MSPLLLFLSLAGLDITRLVATSAISPPVLAQLTAELRLQAFTLCYWFVSKLFLTWQGELAATAVNAPMVPAEVMAELQPFVSLSQGLGRCAVQLIKDTGFTDVKITYASPRYAAVACTPSPFGLHPLPVWLAPLLQLACNPFPFGLHPFCNWLAPIASWCS